ncbi:hypothetical protein EMIT079MI2_130125 [Bacillus sp. IT-79MI2]
MVSLDVFKQYYVPLIILARVLCQNIDDTPYTHSSIGLN